MLAINEKRRSERGDEEEKSKGGKVGTWKGLRMQREKRGRIPEGKTENYPAEVQRMPSRYEINAF